MKNRASGLFQIGEVARFVGVTRKMLLNYEAQGLLTPACQDEESGYRYFINHRNCQKSEYCVMPIRLPRNALLVIKQNYFIKESLLNRACFDFFTDNFSWG